MDGYAALLSSPPRFNPTRPVHPLRQVGPPAARSRARASAIARQRRVLSIMLPALVLPLLVALATGWAAAWWVVAVLPVVLSYVAVVVRTRRQMAEREINVAFFGANGRVVTGLEDVFSRPADDGPMERLAAGGGGGYR